MIMAFAKSAARVLERVICNGEGVTWQEQEQDRQCSQSQSLPPATLPLPVWQFSEPVTSRQFTIDLRNESLAGSDE